MILLVRLQSHENEVADQVGLTQLTTGGIHALEYELWVVPVTVKRNVDDHELIESMTQRSEIKTESIYLLLKEGEIPGNVQ